MSKDSSGRNPRRNPVQALSALVLIALALALVEGVSSLALLGVDLVREAPNTLRERAHTEYDPLLGWVNIPDMAIEGLYGPGRDLHTNSQGFRNRGTISAEVPAGRTRIICSGDSFTLGYGVDDDDTWCAALETLDPKIQSVNMGQGGYGAGQAFLWYERDGTKLAHDYQVFAFITHDFVRMQSSRFHGYGKPRLVVRGDSLAVENVPVPTLPIRYSWITARVKILKGLQTYRLLDRLFRKARRASEGGRKQSIALRQDAAMGTLSAVFDKLIELNREKGSKLVLLYLPVRTDTDSPDSDSWRETLGEYCKANGVTFVDAVLALRQLSEIDTGRMFLGPGRIGAGHLSEAGNAWVAGMLYEALPGME